ncbi:MAG: autotransporter-associated beta strand repeat-containing protein [Verrucomicrobiae bacterium]|nr:autotransporter-associated beta strand repeat-containing protein [Verrucomicrobiae bacterium]
MNTIKKMTTSSFGQVTSWAVALSLLSSAAQADPINKADTGTDLTDGASWVDGSAPGGADVATWVTDSLGGAFIIDSPIVWLGLDVQAATAPISFSGEGLLTLGGLGLNLAETGVGMTADMAWELSEAQTWSVGPERSLILNGTNALNLGDHTLTLASEGLIGLGSPIIGTGGLVLSGTNVVVLAGATTNFAAGDVVVNDGWFVVGDEIVSRTIFDQTQPRTITVNPNAVLLFNYRNALGAVAAAPWPTTQLIVDGGKVQSTTDNVGSVNVLVNPILRNGAVLEATRDLGANYTTFELRDTIRVEGTIPSTIVSAGGRIAIGDPAYYGSATAIFDVADASGDAAPDLTISAVIADAGSKGVAPGSLTKIGAGTLRLTAANTYSGPTAIDGGTLIVDGKLSGVNDVYVNWSGTLGGTGVIGASVYLNDGGTIALGPELGTLTVSNYLQILNGATYVAKVNADTQESDLVTGFYSGAYYGRLVISNISGAFASGQSFQILGPNGYGDWESITPAPGDGMAWSFDAASGVLSIVTEGSVVKANDGTELADAYSWIGWVLPGSDDIANWLSTSLGGELTLNYGDTSWRGLHIQGATEPINLTGGSKLSLGAGGLTIDSAGVNLTSSIPLEVTANQTWTIEAERALQLTDQGSLEIPDATVLTVAGDGTVEVDGLLNGAGALHKTGAGLLSLKNYGNNFSGNTVITGGRLQQDGQLGGDVTMGSQTTLGGSGVSAGSLTTSNQATLNLVGGFDTTGSTFNGVDFYGPTYLDFETMPMANTTYDVITYGAGGLANFENLIPLARGELADDSLNTKVTFTAAAGRARTWNVTDGVWNRFAALTNWVEEDQLYYQGDLVSFGDLGVDAEVTLEGMLFPGGSEVSVDPGEHTYTFTGTGSIAGDVGLTKSGAGTLILVNQNDYTGATTISAGTLQAGNGGTTGMWGSGALVNDGFLVLDRSDDLLFPNTITGTGTLVKNGDNTLTLSGAANAFAAGDLVINGGLTRVGAAENNVNPYFSADQTRTLVVNTNATLQFVYRNAFGGANAPISSRVVIDGGRVEGTNGTSGALNRLVDPTLRNGAVLEATKDLSTYVTYELIGTVSVEGTLPSTITSGTGRVGIGNASMSYPDQDWTTFAVDDVSGDEAEDLTISAVIADSGKNGINRGKLVKTGPGTLRLTALPTYSGGTEVLAGTLQVNVATGPNDGAIRGALFVDAAGVFEYEQGNAANAFAGNISGSGIIRKRGGNFGLTGTNTFSGTYYVEAGTLGLSGANAVLGQPNVVLNGSLAIGAGFVGGAAKIGNLSGTGNISGTFNPDSGLRSLEVNQTETGVFSGNLRDGTSGRTIGFIKAGPAQLTLDLDGKDWTYSGPTTVQAGTLYVASGTNVNSVVTVESGAVFGGAGAIEQTLNLEAGATFTNHIGTPFNVGTLNVNGDVNLAVTTDVPLGPGQYPVIHFTNLGGAGALSHLSIGGAGLIADASASVVVTEDTVVLEVLLPDTPEPIDLTWTITDDQMVLDWPAEQGWLLEAQTNHLDIGLTGEWQVVSNAVPPFSVAIDPTNPAVFFRLRY